MKKSNAMPMSFPIEQNQFWGQIKQIIKEDVSLSQKGKAVNLFTEAPGLTEKPLYRINELCAIFNISRTTIYDWVKHGKLKKVKVWSRVCFIFVRISCSL